MYHIWSLTIRYTEWCGGMLPLFGMAPDRAACYPVVYPPNRSGDEACHYPRRESILDKLE